MDGSVRGWVYLLDLCSVDQCTTVLGVGVIDCELDGNEVALWYAQLFLCLPQEILKENLRMFELVQKHPSHWPPFVPPAKPEVTTTGAGKLFLCGTTVI